MDSAYKVVYTQRAYENLDQILGYISDILCNPRAAKDLYINFTDAIKSISQYPYSMPQAKYKGKKNFIYRKIIIKNFIAIYRVDESAKIIYMLTFRYVPMRIGDSI